MNKTQTRYKFTVCPGNNSNIVRMCMQLRMDRWEETNNSDKIFNFKWQPYSRGIQFDVVNQFGTRQLINHFNNHAIITTKHQLFENMAVWCELKKINVFKILPITFTLQMENINCAVEMDKFLQYFCYLQLKQDVIKLNKKFGSSMHLPQFFKIQEKVRNAGQTSKFELPSSHF